MGLAADRSRPGIPHVPALDGVRGVAVAAVLLFHGGVAWATGGFLGVDAFFVLSGYLITTLLLREHEHTHGISLRSFWARRARRLLPALFLVVAAVGAYAAWVAEPDALESIRLDALATLGYVANWRFVAQGSDYFAHAGVPSPLLHAWSLAIEEQFYLLFPLAAVAAIRLTKRPARALALGAAALAVASAVGMALAFHPGGDTSRLYYGTDTRAQSVLVGVALGGLLAWRRPQRLTRVLGWIAAAVAVALAATLAGDSPALYRGGFLAFSVAVAAVIAHVVGRGTSPLTRALGTAPLAWTGRVSYGLYLWHWPVYLTLTHERTGLESGALLGVRLAATTAIATASYYLVELPIRRGNMRPFRVPALRLAAAPVALAATAGLVVVATTVPVERSTTPTAAAAAPRTGAHTASVVPRRPPPPPDRPVRVLLFGDSVAYTIAQGMTKVAARFGTELVDRSQLGCGVIRGGPYRYFGEITGQPPGCDDWPRRWADDLRTFDPDVVLLVAGRWEVMDRVVAGRWTHVGMSRFDEQLRRDLEEAVRVLTATGAPLVLTTAPYYHRGERPDGGTWPEDEPARVERINAIVRSVAARHPDRVAVADLAGRLAPHGNATVERVIDGVRVRSGDGVHVTIAGGRWLGPWLLPQLTLLVRPPAGAATAPATAPPPR